MTRMWREVSELVLEIRGRRADVAGPVPHQVVLAAKRLLEQIVGKAPWAVALGERIDAATLGRFRAEAECWARMVDADCRAVLAANCYYDLLLAGLGCSTLLLATDAGPVLARNMDFWPEDLLAQASCLLHVRREGQAAASLAGFAGGIGAVTGLSPRGFGLALNMVWCAESRLPHAAPVLYALRQVLEDAADFDDARRRLGSQPLWAAALISLIGTDNSQRVVIERTPSRAAERWARGAEPLVATNHYRQLHPAGGEAGSSLFAALWQTSCGRYERLLELARQHPPSLPVADDALLTMLTDSAVQQQITAQHVILRPRDGTVGLWVPTRLAGNG
jgi:hypothetical protein